MAWAGCDDALTPEEQMEVDRQLIESYVAQNGLEGFYTDTGIFVSFEEEVSGTDSPNSTSTLELVYTGKFLDGEEFDSSQGLAVELSLRQVIPGWREGLQYFTEGSEGTLIIPSPQAYGTRGTRDGSIPPNTVLLFEIELLSVR